MRDLMKLSEGIDMKHFVGTCVSSFNEDGDCLLPEIGWSHVSDLAVADENAMEIPEEEFLVHVIIPDEVMAAIQGHEVSYLSTDNGVLMLYDADSDIHYFFV